MHPLFPEVKSYELLDNKKIKIYYKDGYSIKEKYMFQSTAIYVRKNIILEIIMNFRKVIFIKWEGELRWVFTTIRMKYYQV